MTKKNKFNWKSSILSEENIIKDAIKNLNKTNLQISLVTKKNKLIGTITDGDIRRGLLKGFTLKDKVKKIMKKNAITVGENTDYKVVKEIMKSKSILQIPIVSREKKILGLHFWNKPIFTKNKKNVTVIMAGGFGKRMKYKTSFTPKPMIQLHGKPILEHIINNLKNYGLTNICISTFYLEHKIRNYFKNGKKFGVKIKYLREKKPLGTAGSLAQLAKNKKTPILVTNGDVISNINYLEILNYHKNNKADATMAVREITSKHTFGVVESRGYKINRIEEKPVTKTHINAGIYVINNELLRLIKKNKYLNMTDFFNQLIIKKKKTILFPMHENWQDFAKPNDLNISRKKFGL